MEGTINGFWGSKTPFLNFFDIKIGFLKFATVWGEVNYLEVTYKPEF